MSGPFGGRLLRSRVPWSELDEHEASLVSGVLKDPPQGFERNRPVYQKKGWPKKGQPQKNTSARREKRERAQPMSEEEVRAAAHAEGLTL
eukprot:5892702-Prymnesium_polylepis.1